MSIYFTMYRLATDGFENCQKNGALGEADVDESDDGIDKAWGVLQRILAADFSGQAGAAAAINGGEPLPNEPMDYGGVRLLPPEDVRSISRALDNISEATIERGCRELDFRDSYPGVTDAADHVDYYVINFRGLRDFYTESARQGAAMVLELG